MPSYESRTFDGSNLAFTRIDPQVDFDWGAGTPDARLTTAAFLVRWTGFLRVAETDDYLFTLSADDGVRLWVDEKPLVDDWTDHLLTTTTGQIRLTANTSVPVLLEYYQHVGKAAVTWAWSHAGQPDSVVPAEALFPPADANGLSATYFTGMAFERPAVSRTDLDVAFRWGLRSPDPRVPGDRFSARWVGSVEARYSELFTFFLLVEAKDEGIRLLVDGTTVIDAWQSPHATEVSGMAALEAGKRYPITLEYAENIGPASIELQWASDRQPRSRVSWHRLRPSP